ncbi:CHAT domain-containing protein [Pantanalinema sp. GBBB05]|uniref:CHAT domain-containing protein n=1 Tax=Pantanalinema sp. GBBB05 TaxID=2604139 RepID=UPI001DDA71B3|nr:CHAT domain-containing protein [Pantanalinema sp. GBBB05]
MYKFLVRSWLQWCYFQLHQLSFLSLVMLSLGMTLILAQLPAMSQEAVTEPPWMQQVAQGNQFYQNQQYTEAVQIWQNLAEKLRGDHLNQAMALSNLALVYQQLGQWQEAEQAVLRSRQLLERVTNQGNRHDQVLAQTLDIQGQLHLTKGQPEKALTLWQQSEQLYRHLENKTAIAQSQINQAQALQKLGNYVLAQKQLTQAIQGLREEDSLLRATGWRSLGNVLRQVGELKASRQALLSAHKIAQGLQPGRLEAEILLDLGNLEFSEAQRLQAIGRTEDAERCTQLAHKYFQDVIQQTKDLPELQLRASLNDLATLIERVIETKQFALVLERFPTLQPLIESIPLGHFSIYARLRYVQQGMKLLQAGDQIKQTTVSVRSLVAHTQIALQQAQELQDQRAEAQALGQLGELYASNQQWQEAQQLTQKALDLANTPDLMYQLQWQMGRLLSQQQDNQVANLDLAIAHYTTAISALDKVRYNLMPADPDVQFSFRDQIEPVYRQLVNLLLRQESPENLNKAVKYIDELQLAELENFLRCPIPPQERLTEFKDPTAAMIYPIVLPEQLAIILQLPDQPLIYKSTPISGQEIEARLNEFREILADSSETPKVEPLAKKIYQWILQPIEENLKQANIKTLVFAPDGLLRNIPLAVLHDGNDYLINSKYAIAVASKLKLFEPIPLPSELNMLTGGISEGKSIDVNGLKYSFTTIEQLEKELKEIGINSIARTRQSLLNEQFTINNLKSQLKSGDFSAIHLKTHGMYSSDPASTFIVAHDEPITSQVFSELIKIASKDRTSPLELLVLSACNSAEGDDRAVLGLAGLAANAGVKSTIASLWQAQDTTNTQLMIKFYQELAKPGVNKAQALQHAQQLIFQSDQRPYIWASYILVGNWQ